MPKLIRLSITSALIGFALSALFLGLLLWLDVAGFRHLVMGTPSGGVAAVMLFVVNGIIFAGVQFAIVIMWLTDDDEPPQGGLRAPFGPRAALMRVPVKVPVKLPVKLPAKRPRKSAK